MRRSILSVLLAVLCTALAACGGGGSHTTTHPKPPPPPNQHNLSAPTPSACKPGEGHMGCAVPHQLGINFHNITLPSNQGLVPDVYEGDPVFSWAQAKPHIVGAIVKAYEYRQDGYFVSNWRTLSALHIWHAAYIFLHSDCGAVSRYIGLVNSVGGFRQAYVGPPIIDAEVPDARVAIPCAVNTLERATGRVPIIYSAPGTWPGGSHGDSFEWSAGYGNYSHCPVIWTGNCIAWQYTDGQWGPFPHQITGLRVGDISVSYGIQHLVVVKPKPKPVVKKCFGKNPSNSATCKKKRAEVAAWTRARNASNKAYATQHCNILAQRRGYFAYELKKHPHSPKVPRWRGALRATQKTYAKRSCAVFARRASYFNHLIQTTITQ